MTKSTLTFFLGIVVGMIFWTIIGLIVHKKSFENGKIDHFHYTIPPLPVLPADETEGLYFPTTNNRAKL